MEEILASGLIKDADLRDVLKFECNARIQVQQDKIVITYQVDSLNSMTPALRFINSGALVGENIDLIVFKEGIEKQIDKLITSR